MKQFLLVLIISLVAASHGHAATPCIKLGLITSFDPAEFNRANKSDANYSSPVPNAKGVPSNYASLLTGAYNIASNSVQAALCKLDYVFVVTDTNAGHAWEPVGVWEPPGRGNGWHFIAIPSSFLDPILQKPESLANEENDLYTRLFNTNFSSFSDTGGKSSKETAALAIIAHELGHVVFAATNADGLWYHQHPYGDERPGPVPDTCFDTEAFLTVWDAKTFHSNHQRRWVKFGNQGEPNANKYLDANIDFAKLKDQVKHGSTSMMNYLYQAGGLASMFASAAPEEDFVETFKYYALSSASTHPDLTIAGITNAVSRVHPGAAGELATKVNCILKLLPTMPAATVKK
jgi:hypothetical protein